MKTLLLVVFSLMVFTCSFCSVHKKSRYAIPKDMNENEQQRLVGELDKGGELYKTKCGSCHGKYMSGKNDDGDFSAGQLYKYSAGSVLSDMHNHSAALKMNPQDLSEIILFLRYRIAAKTNTEVQIGGF